MVVFATGSVVIDFNHQCLVRKPVRKISDTTNANLGTNAPNYSYPIPVVFGIEILASALLIAVILVVVHTKGLKGFSGIVIGGIVGLDIFFLAFISDVSMNPPRSLAPAIVSDVYSNLWLYFTAIFVGTSVVAFILRGKFEKQNRK